MPGTWQDVVVTVVAALAGLAVLRPLVPAAWLGRRAAPSSACPSCAAGNACATVRPVTASATPIIQVRRTS